MNRYQIALGKEFQPVPEEPEIEPEGPFGAFSAGPFGFDEPHLIIQSDGNVGIGTSSPTENSSFGWSFTETIGIGVYNPSAIVMGVRV